MLTSYQVLAEKMNRGDMKLVPGECHNKMYVLKYI